VTIQFWEVRAVQDFETVFAVLKKEQPDGLYVSSSLVISAYDKRITDFALKSRLPSMYSVREPVYAGGLMYYGADLVDSYRRVASYVDRILKGANPADLPIEQSRKFELAINLRTAREIGLAFPPNVLARADRVIK
jgi:putative ABC transport system substrate-binding protein